MPESLRTRAADLLAAFLKGNARPSRIAVYRSHFLCFRLGLHWRLLCTHPEQAQNPEAWELLSHSQYDAKIAKR
jgi:hypothetical protein